MRRLARQWLAGALVVVTALGGAAGSMLAADHHAHQRAGAQLVDTAHQGHHGHEGHHHDDASGSVGGHASHDDGTENDRTVLPSSGCCPSDHGHCCTVTTLQVASSTPKPSLRHGARLIDAGPPVPLGQLSNPLFRPPKDRA